MLFSISGETLASLSCHGSLFLLELLMLHSYNCWITWVWIDWGLGGVCNISIRQLRIREFSKSSWLFCLLLLPACVKVLFILLRSVFQPHLLLSAFIGLCSAGSLFRLYFLLVLLFIIINHISEKRWVLMTTKKVALWNIPDMVWLLFWRLLSWNCELFDLVLKNGSLILRLRSPLLRLWFLDLILRIVLLLELGHKSFLNVAEMRVLESCKLLEFCWPHWIDVALFSCRTCYRTSDQILVCIHKLMIL